VGAPDFAHTRRYVYEGTRGDVGRLAVAVAASADRDSHAADILCAAGGELARLARILLERFGPRPVTLTGRAAALHPLIFDAMRAALPTGTPLDLRACRGHHAAAHLAVRSARGTLRLAAGEVEP
jgi:glucosamine kinase